MKSKFATAVSLFIAHSVSAQSISINFGSNEGNGSINTGSSLKAGAIPIEGTYWNNMSGATQATGQALNDSAGAATGSSVTWASANTWRSGSTGGTGASLNGNLTKGYLDDGGSGYTVTVTNIPYLTYNTYVILGSDQGGATESTNSNYRPVTVNGVAYRGNNVSGTLSTSTVAGSAIWTGKNWTDDNSLAEGSNYLKITGQVAPTLSVNGGTLAGGRGPISGLQVENSYTGTLSYWDIDGATSGAGGATPTGNWTDSNWSSDVTGSSATSNWTAGRAAVFSAGTNASGAFTVNVSGTQSADAIWVQEGALTLSGGDITLGVTGLIRADGAGSANVSSNLGGTNLSTAGNVTLTGANSYTGSTTVNSGNLTLAGGASIPDASAVTISGGATMTLSNAETIGSLAGGGTAALGANALSITNSGTNTFSGAFTGSGNLSIGGSGTQILSGNSPSYTGNLTVASGVTLQVGNSAATFGTSAGTTTVQSGGTIMINSATSSYLQPGSGEVFRISGTGVGNIGALSSNAGGGGIIKEITLLANASIGGTTRWDIGGGGAGQQAVINGGGFVLTKTGVNNIWMRGTTGGSGIINLAGLIIDQGVFGVEFGDNVFGSTPVTVNPNGTFSAWTSPSNIQGNPITLNGGTLDVDAGNITFSGAVTLTANSFINSDAGNMTVSGNISESGGSYGFTKSATNTATITGTNSYTGPTNVTGGILAVSNGSALPDNAALNLNGGGLTLNNSETVGSLSGNASGNVTLGANHLTINQTVDGTLAGTISGTGNFIKNGSANLTLSGTSGLTGTTTVNNGTLTLGAGGASGSIGSSAIVVESGAVLLISVSDGTGYGATAPITLRGTMTKGAGNFHDTLNRPVTLDGGSITATDGNTTSGAAYNLFGNTISTTTGSTNQISITDSTLQLRTNGVATPIFNVAASSVLTINAVVDGYLGTETTALTKSGAGTMVLTQNNLYDGATQINAGKIIIGNGGTTGSFGAGAVTNNGQVEVNRSNAHTVANDISGSGSLDHTGTGTTTLSGISSYNGATSVSAGTLLVTGSLGATNVSVSAAATFGGTGSIGGDLVFDGASTLQIMDLNDSLAVTGTISFANSGFGIDNLSGISDWDSVANGTYVLLTGIMNDANLQNLGEANKVPIGTLPDRYAYFNNGSLELVIIPEPSVTLLGGLGLMGLALRRRRH